MRDACSTPTCVKRVDSIVGCPLCSAVSNFNAFYSAVDGNVRDLVICLWKELLSEFLSGFFHFIVPYGLFFLYHSIVYIREYITFYSVSVVLPLFLPKTLTIHKIELLVFALTLLPPSSTLTMFS